jgi:hypothetical protein
VTLPLADFGSASFTQNSVRTSSGHTGGISNRGWGSTTIALNPGDTGGRQYVSYNGAGPAAGTATPSPLRDNGSAFTVTFGTIPLSGLSFYARKAGAVPAGRLYHR